MGLREAFMRHRLTVSGGGVTLRKEMFGRSREKILAAASVTSVSQKEFYQQNYKPIYGIEIKGTGGKLRFGSSLTEDEKAWLVADIWEAVFGREETELKIPVPGHAPAERKEVFSIAIPGPPKHAWIFGLNFTLMSLGFMCFGIFAMEGDTLPEKEEGASYVSNLVFSLFSNGFRGIWLLMTTVFAGLGIFILVSNLRGMGQDRRIEGNSAEISIRTYERGLVVKDKSFARNSVTDIRASTSGSSNGKQMKRIELIVGDKAEKLSSWVDGDEANELVSQVRAAFG